MIIDDEDAARRNLRRVINSFPELNIVAEITNSASAIRQINELEPDIVFLDIEMPGGNGFDVAKATSHINYQLIFVTAFQNYALDAFETRAIDYLLKPVRPELLKKCLAKILLQEKLAREALIEESNQSGGLILSDGKNKRVIAFHHICYVEGIGRYRQIHLTKQGIEVHKMESLVSDTTLDSFEKKLTTKHFFRNHRGYLVNIDQVNRLYIEARKYVISFNEHDTKIPVSRNKVSQLKERLSEFNRD